MLLFISLFIFVVVTGYYGYRFIQLLIKMKDVSNKVILPLTYEDMSSIRKQPNKALYFPTYSKQKAGIMLYSLVFIVMFLIFGIGMVTKNYILSIYPLIFLPMLHTYNVLNLFAITDEGIFCGVRFIPWSHIKSFEFVRIDVNHKYYGHSQEVNDTYELKLKGKFIPISYIVITKEMKHKLTKVLHEYVSDDQQYTSTHEG